MGKAMKDFGPFPDFPRGSSSRMTHFASLARSIIYQQLAGGAASSILARVTALTPGPAFPRPVELLSLPRSALLGAGLSRNKARALLDLAGRVESGELGLRGIGRLDDGEIVERLVRVYGIGVWSAQMFLIFKLGRLDVLPTTDLGVQEGARRLYRLDRRPGPGELEEMGRAWAPLRSAASWTLWRIKDGVPR